MSRMAEVMRLLASRLREYVINRRSARRYKVNLPASIALVASKYVGKQDAKNGKAEEQVSSFISGHTRDISESGIGVVVSKIHIEGRYLTDQDRLLLIKVELPNEDIIQFKAVAKRHQPVEKEQNEKGFLIGAQIKDIDEENRAKLIAYLKDIQK